MSNHSETNLIWRLKVRINHTLLFVFDVLWRNFMRVADMNWQEEIKK